MASRLSDIQRKLVLRATVIACVAFIIGFAVKAVAVTPDPDVTAAATGLKELAQKLDTMPTWTKPAVPLPLTDSIPLTGLDPSEALNMDELFGGSLKAALDAVSDFEDLGDLQAAITDAGTLDPGGVNVTMSGVSVVDNPTDASLIDISFTFDASKVVSTPMDVTAGVSPTVVDLDGGGVSLTFGLNGTMSFQFDRDLRVASPNEAFYMVGTPTLNLSVNASGAFTAFEGQFGFTELSVTGNSTVDFDADVDLKDPDSNGKITKDEINATTIVDLVDIAIDDNAGTDAIAALLNLDSSLIAGSPDASITLNDPDLSNGLNAPSLTIGQLGSLDNLSVEDVLAALAQLVAGLGAAQNTSDFTLPFMQDKLGVDGDGAPYVVKKLSEFIAKQKDAAIRCGTTNTDPPTGSVLNLADETDVFCQAVSPADATPGTVAWVSPELEGINTSGAAANNTVKIDPTVNAHFEMDGPGDFEVELTFTDALGAHTVIPRVRSAQELLAKLDAAADFDGAASNLAYDTSTKALTYRLIQSQNPGAKTAELDFGDKLKTGTNLIGLSPGSAASASINPGSIDLDVTFGMLFVDDVADITPGDELDFPSSQDDRFFLKVDDAAGAHELEIADAAVTANVDLKGKIGFLEVSATGNPVGPTAFAVAKSTPSDPMFTLDINPPTDGVTLTVDGSPVAVDDAIRIRELLATLDTSLSADVNVGVTGGLKLTAKTGSPPTTLGEGTVEFTWTDIATQTEPIVTASTQFNEQLKIFDIAPGYNGTHNGAVDAASLTDTTKDFSVDPYVLNARLKNLTDDSSCVVLVVTGLDTLECSLGGGTDNNWDPGDKYEVEGNPLVMLSLILDKLDELLAAIESISGPIDDDLPLIKKSPKDLIAQIQNLKALTDELRGAPTAIISCSKTNADPLPGGPSNDPTRVDDGDDVFCQARTTRPVTAATWTITGIPGGSFTGGANGSGAGALSTVGLDPSANVTFNVNDNVPTPPGAPDPDTTNLGEFKIHLAFTDSTGEHSADLPSITPPQSLQDMETAIETKLGLGTSALKLDLMDIATSTAISTGTHDGGSGAATLSDSGADFVADGVLVGHLLHNTTDHSQCTITARTTTTISCVLAGGAENDWDAGDAYQVTGDGKKDLVIRLGYGICTDNDMNAGTNENTNPDADCAASDRLVPKPETKINLDLGDTGLVALDSDSTFKLEYLARTRFEFGVSLEKLPKIKILDTSEVILAAGVSTDNVNLDANVGPVHVTLGSQVLIADGSHTGGSDSTTTVFDDSAGNDFNAAKVPLDATLKNVTDNSTCPITGVGVTGTSITCSTGLTGGTDNKFQPGDTYQVYGLGMAKLGGSFSLDKNGVDADDDNEAFEIGIFVGDLGADLGGPTTPFDCGRVDHDGPNGPMTPLPTVGTLDGDACARLALGLVIGTSTSYLGELGFRAENFEVFDDPGSESEYYITIPPDLESQILSAVLDWTMLLQALEELLLNLEQDLDGGAAGTHIPIIGDALDGGSQVVNHMRTKVVSPINAILASLQGLGTAGAISDQIKDTINDAIGATPSLGLTLLKDGTDPGDDIGPSDVTVTAICDDSAMPPVECVAGDAAADIDDLRIRFEVGQGVPISAGGCTTDCAVNNDVPFNIGIPGLPIRATGSLAIDVGWSLIVDFGLSRDGPYLYTDHGPDPELNIGASVGLGDDAGSCDDGTDLPVGEGGLAGYSTTRCLYGELGFLAVNIMDGNDTPGDPDKEKSELTLGVVVDISSSTGRIGFDELTAGDVSIDPDIVALANIDIRFRTGLRDGEQAGFPSVLGTFHLAFDFNDTDKLSELRFAHLYLDIGKFFEKYLNPILEEINDIVSPFKPIIDFLRAPLPVISDLAELVGADPVTLLSIMELLTGNDLSLLESILAFLDFVSSPITTSGFIPLGNSPGAFEVDKALALGGPVSPDQAGNLVRNTGLDAGSSLMDRVGAESGEDVTCPGCERPGTFGVEGLTFPFLDNATEIFGALMGKDVVLVRYDVGTFGADAGASYSFGPITFGPVPVTITIGVDARVEGRFAFGYDTSGLRKVLDGASGEHLFDGIFIDDLDALGNDVPEIKFIGTVYAGAAVDILIFSVGVKGGIEFTTELNLHDGPDIDGKLHIEEIFDKLENPICLFDISGKIDAFLAVFIEVDLFFWSETWEFELVRVTLLEFSGECSPPPPNPADVDDQTGDTIDDLIINIGSRAANRNIKVNEIDEKVVVRQLNNTATRFSITMFGAYEEETIPAGGKIVVLDAADGKDVVSLQPGVEVGNADGDSTQEETFDFTAASVVNLGSGDDSFTGGLGVDDVDGGANNDRIVGNAGADVLDGGSESDTVEGGQGHDVIHGNAGDDKLSGGAANDDVYGDEDNDVIAGGPGLETSPNPALVDTADNLYGGIGEDTINGSFGNDYLYGDDTIACTAGGAATGGRDDLDGAKGDDHLFGGYAQDHLVGGQGNDPELCGNLGDDTIDGDDEDPLTPDGDDFLDGGEDNDTLYGRGGHDRLEGDSGSGNDVLFGGPGADDLIGGDGKDLIRGEDGADIALGDAGTIDAHAASAHDTIAGMLAIAHPADPASSGSVSEADCGAVTPLGGSGNADCIFGGNDGDVLFGEGGPDIMKGDAGADHMGGNIGADLMRGGTDPDTMLGNGDGDEMHGDSGDDDMFGNAGVDTMRGGINDDYMEGNEAGDIMNGDADQDDIIGGTSSAGAADGADTIFGNAHTDYIAGDNAKITRPGGSHLFNLSVKRVVELLDINSADGTLSGADKIEGNEADDVIYGQGNDDDADGDADGLTNEDPADGADNDGDSSTDEDTGGDFLRGNAGDDYVEGNAGADLILGDDGQDDLIGGTGRSKSDDPLTALPGRLDGPDIIYGGRNGLATALDYDAITGDNATIDRPLTAGLWTINSFNAAVSRTLYFYDVGTTLLAAGSGTSGNDRLFGEANDDLIYGQGGNDYERGGNGDDYMEGNDGVDEMFGDANNDDMVGGTGRINGDPAEGSDGRLDKGEKGMSGGTGFDWMAGDNSVITRVLVSGQWVAETFRSCAPMSDCNGVKHNPIVVRDVPTLAYPAGPAGSGTAGGDTMYGNEQDDVMYGQANDNDLDDDGNGIFNDDADDDVDNDGDAIVDEDTGGDLIHGNDGADYIEGNAGADFLYGDAGQDDIIGGGSEDSNLADTSEPDLLDGHDSMFGESDTSDGTAEGDSGDAMLGDNGKITRPLSETGLWIPNTFNGLITRQFQLFDVETNVALPTSLRGNDRMWGNDNDDVMYGQGGDDLMYGNAGEDYMEGNHDIDHMYGGTGEDDMLGGTGRINSDPADGTQGRLDKGDFMYGGPDHDVMTGDNAIVTRPLDAAGAWKPISYNHENGTHDGANVATGDGKVRTTRSIKMIDSTFGVASGSDLMRGEAGDDDIIGQFDDTQELSQVVPSGTPITVDCGGAALTDPNPTNPFTYVIKGDLLCGDIGEDAIAGDQAVIVDSAIQAGDPRTKHLNPNEPFFDDDVFPTNSLYREAELFQVLVGGNDFILGGNQGDFVHAGAGDDIANGEDAEDALFGGDGTDGLWGGPGHDHGYGGHGPDFIDVRPRSAIVGQPDDPDEWFIIAPDDGNPLTPFQGFAGEDIHYGGFDADAMQADVAQNGPNPGDRLIDWVGAFNVFYLCPATYGDYVSTRDQSPSILSFVNSMAHGDGVKDVLVSTSPGYRELGLVYKKDVKVNSHPAHPDTPGHFTC